MMYEPLTDVGTASLIALQLRARHSPTTQEPVRQSLAAEHAFPSRHFAHEPPPQSMSVSAPSLVPFGQSPAQVGPELPTLVQRFALQSALTRHALVAPHLPQVPPPQS